MRFDILNRLGVAHVCDGRTDGRTEPLLAIARSNEAFYENKTHNETRQSRTGQSTILDPALH